MFDALKQELEAIDQYWMEYPDLAGTKTAIRRKVSRCLEDAEITQREAERLESLYPDILGV